MAVFSLKNFNEFFSDQAKLWATKCVVRECDEESKGRFVAFVDQGSETYDVSVDFGKAKEISQISCDCKKGDGFCHHKLALLLFVAGNKKVETPKIVKKKKSGVETIFDELTFEDLKNWLLEVFEKEKPLKAEFELKFSADLKVDNTAEGIKKALKDLSKSVVGSRKTLETLELKKIMGLWENFVFSACKPYFLDPTILVNFQILKYSLDAIDELVSVYRSKSFTYFNNLIKNIKAQIVVAFDSVKDDDKFSNGIDLYFGNIIYKPDTYDIVFVNIIMEINKMSSQSRQKIISDNFSQFYSAFHKGKKSGDKNLSFALWNMASTNGTLNQYLDILLPVVYANEYNIDLIQALVGIGKIEKARELCQRQIDNNFHVEYSLPYYNILKEIFLKKGDRHNYLNIAKEILPYTQNIDDFFEIYNDMPLGEEKMIFKNQTLAKMRAKAKLSDNYDSAKFCVSLLGRVSEFKKLITYLQDYKYISLFEPYLESMLKVNKITVLKNIFDNFGSYPWDVNQELLGIEKSSFISVLDALQNTFTEYELQTYVEQFRNKKYHRKDEGTFVHFILKHV
ncbi:hypothetical protein EGI22_12075 [Lacihabitans sp. LS3-19]|uniref:SWIM zinc finger family protein n=1 Tax=Lacihabitans sp. LS3-19 TaxID=2487335 RepID=UPI0020CD22F5|nr:hypothetical protein [Lacihabitans sp. LS3-19]MCP9768654.1 hypothetical protein [Lacihabitans sp. LS3-19]